MKYILTILLLISYGTQANEVKQFLSNHCFDCHDEDMQKGGVRLDNLKTDLSSPEMIQMWTKVYDQVSHGDMPPKKKKRPAADKQAKFLTAISRALINADSKRKEVVMRRLNREELQNTVNDLLHIKLNMKYLLPEDPSTAGFDNVGEGMAISTELMESYMEFADQVVEHALFSKYRPKSIDKTWNFKDSTRVKKNTKRIKFTDGGAVLFHQGDLSSTTLYEFRAPLRGTYRITFQASAWKNTDKKPLKIRLDLGNVSVPGQSWIEEFYGVTDEKKTITVEAHLNRGGTVRLAPFNTEIFSISDAKTTKKAGVWVGDIHIKGPLENAWPVKSVTSFLDGTDPKKGTREDAERIIRKFLPKAFRRSVAQCEIESYLSLYDTIFKKSKSFNVSIKVVLKAVLCSADFLFLVEKGQGQVSDYELASRLSYFLWSSTPDKELLQLAESGKLNTPKMLKAQTERMLKDPKASRFITNFTGQWLRLRDIDATAPDKKLYPEFDEHLRFSLVKETELFFKEILMENLPVSNFIDSDFTFLNDRLANHYGISNIKGSKFRRVKLPKESPRGGLMTMASVLKVTANGTDTSPILRGVWMMENILGVHVPPPPPGVPAVEPDIRGTVTIREQLEAHRKNASCNNCHSKIDPVGFAFENFDPVGMWRDYYRTMGGKGNHVKKEYKGRRVYYRKGPDVEANDLMPDGSKFSGIKEFKKILLKKSHKVSYCLTEKMAVYALGRSMGFSDRPYLKKITGSKGLKDLVHGIIQSEIFKLH